MNFKPAATTEGTVVDTAPGTVDVTSPGMVAVADPGTVVETKPGTDRTHLLPTLGTYETPELLTPNPLRFCARADTTNFLPIATFLTVHRVADLDAMHVALPTFTSVEIKGDFAFVVALVNTTVTSTFPPFRLFVAVIPEIVGLDGFAVTEEADAVADAEIHNKPPTVKLETILEIFNRNLP